MSITTGPVGSNPAPAQERPGFLSVFQSSFASAMDPWDSGTYPVVPVADVPAPTILQNIASHAVAREFNVATTYYDRKAYLTTSPAAKLLWGRGPLGTVTKTVSSDSAVMASALVELSRHGDSVKGNGESHVLLTKEKEHAYVIMSPWHKVPDGYVSWWTRLRNFNDFRMLALCFPAGAGELPSTAAPPVEGIEPKGASRDAIVAHRREVLDNGDQISALIALGRSSIVNATGYTELKDEASGLLLRWCRMSTSSYHVLDGYLTWALIFDTRNNRFMYVAIGDGKHPLPHVDQLNPILGGAMMCTKVKTMATLLQAPVDKVLLTNTTAPKSLDDLVRQLDPELGRQRELLRLLDEVGILGSEARRHVGGITTKD
jgi:hypothetical protein